jgi:hypothetical protein
MALRSSFVFAIAALVGFPSIARASAPCDAVTAHRDETVIVFAPPSTFTICRDGHEENDVVTGRRTYLELASTPGAGMFRFRVHGQEAEPKLTGLSRRAKDVRSIAMALDELAHSSAHIASLSFGGESTPLGAARARYLGVVTPAFSDALARSRGSIGDLTETARIVRRWCDELHSADARDPTELRAACAGAPSADDVDKDVARFGASAAAFDSARDLARESAIAAAARGDEASATTAAKMLDLARTAADGVVNRSSAIATTASSLERRLGALRAVIASLGALRPGAPTYLVTYSEAGNAVLRIDAIPVGVEDDARDVDENQVAFRFPVVGRHYFDVELGAGVTGGQPLIPTVGTSGNAAVIGGKPVDEFVALALVELEPLRFAWPDKPLAGLVRFPVIGIPLSRDPTENFFVGGGIGWTGVGSITAGPYLLRELTLDPGHSIGDQLPPGTSLDAITSPAVHVGFFVSASIDVVGLFRLFFPEHSPTLDAASGREQ